jgi:ABC-type lipoprotein release transport system permease subunit
MKHHPLSPVLFLWRNPGRSLPLMLVLALAVLTIACVVALLNSIDRTILKIYDYNRYFGAVTPRGGEQLKPELRQLVERAPGVGEVYETVVCFMNAETIVGKMPFVIFGLPPDKMERLVARCGLKLGEGRYPAPGAPEVALSEPLMRNKKLRLGDVVLSPFVPDQYAPVPVRVVGVLKGDTWLAVTSEQFTRTHFFPPLRNLLVLAQDVRQQPKLDRWLRETLRGKQARVWTYAELQQETHRAFKNLYFITGVVVVLVSLMLATMTGLLANIYFQQRLVEFGLLQAIGYTRRSLLLRVSWETILVVLLGWGLGVLIALGTLSWTKWAIMEPRGLYLEPLDPIAYRYTLPVPVMVLLFALGTIGWRLRTFDPVAIVERRIV